MKILYFNPAINATEGAAIHARELAQGLRNIAVDVQIYPEPLPLVYARSGISEDESRATRFFKESLRFIRGLYRTIRDGFALLRISRGRRFDAILTRNFEYSLAGLIIQSVRGIPLIVEVNALQYLEKRRYGGSVFIALRRCFEKFLLERASAIYVVSEKLAEIVRRENILPKRVEVIENGVDTEKFHPDVSPDAEVWNIVDGRYAFGFVGSLKEWHGTAVLISALKIVADKGGEACVVIVGEGQESESLRTQAERLGIERLVHFVGKRPHEDIPKVLACMEATVAPYLEAEGDFYFSPLKVYEYMAMGKPVIGSQVGQLAQLIEDGQCGLVVAPGEPEQLARAMSTLMADETLSSEYGGNARDKALRHSWNSVAQRVIGMIG